MYGGTEARLGDRMRGGGLDRMNGQGGNVVIRGGPGFDILKTGRGLDRVNAKDGKKDFITCKGTNDLVDYDRGLDVLQGCATRIPVSHKGGELCLPEAAFKGHLEHDEVL